MSEVIPTESTMAIITSLFQLMKGNTSIHSLIACYSFYSFIEQLLSKRDQSRYLQGILKSLESIATLQREIALNITPIEVQYFEISIHNVYFYQAIEQTLFL